MATDDPSRKGGRRGRAGCAAVFAAVVAFLGFRLYREFRPADRVFVTVGTIDPSARSLYLVADTPSGVRDMPWYREKVTSFTAMSATSPVVIDTKWPGSSVTRAVAWIGGRRYGVVVGYAEGPSRVFWFEPGEVHLRWQPWPRGGGEASIELPGQGRGEEFGSLP